MEDEVIVACHAPVLSLLLYETARSIHDQKGLLFGEVFNEVISKKTDDNEINKEHKTVIYIKHCLPIMNHKVFGSVGDIDVNQFPKLLEQKHVVGWYSFRRNTRVLPNTLREILIHKSLLEVIPGCKPELFVAAFMSSNTVAGYSTHTFNHIFTRFNPIRERFEPMKLKIYSLSDKSVNNSSAKTSFPLSHKFDKIISSLKREENPVNSVLSVHDKVGELLTSYNNKLQQLENVRSELENDVKKLKKELGVIKDQDIVVEEEPKKKEWPKDQFIFFNQNIKYNPNRRSNPIQVSIASPVPDDDDADDENEEIEIIDNDEKDRKPSLFEQQKPSLFEQQKPSSTPDHSIRSYANVLNKTASPKFNVKTPKLRVGLSPGLSSSASAKKTSVSNNDAEDIENQDIFESAEEMDEDKITAVNNSQSSNQMETDH